MINIDVAKILSSDEHTPPPHPPPSFQDLLDGIELRTRNSSSSVFSDSPAHSRHGGSPLHSYVPGKTPTQAPISLKPHTHTHKRGEQDKSEVCVQKLNDDPLAAPESNGRIHFLH